MQDRAGVVYTRRWVVDMILDAVGYTPDRNLAALKILEPSCGNGAFLGAIVERLCQSVDRNGDRETDLDGCILAVDIDPESIEGCRRIISDILTVRGFDDASVERLSSSWLRREDFILSEPGSFDFVVGNPPYISSDEIPEERRHQYCDALDSYSMGTDIYVGFIEKGLRCLNGTGKLCYICADRWMQNRYGMELRSFISASYGMELVCRMHGVDAFDSDVSAYPAVILIGRPRQMCRYIECEPDFRPEDAPALVESLEGPPIQGMGFRSYDIAVGGDRPWCISDGRTADLVAVMKSMFPSLEESGATIGIGIATGRDSVFITEEPGIVEPDRLVPIIRKSDIVQARMPEKPRAWLVNPWKADGTLVDLSDHPLLRGYLESNRDSLGSRHVARRNPSTWYRTIDRWNPSLAGRPKLLMPDLSAHPEPYLDDGGYYPSHNMYWLASDTWDLEVLGGILLSEQVERFIGAVGVKMRGGTLRCQAQYLRMLHVPYPWDLAAGEAEGFRRAFRERDRKAATMFMDSVISRRSVDERGYEKGAAGIVYDT